MNTRQIIVKFPDTLRRELKIESAKRGITTSALIVKLLQVEIENIKAKELKTIK